MATVDIWSVPLAEPVASVTGPSDAEDGWQPKRSSLFLPDSDEEDEDGGGPPPRSTPAPSSKDNDPLAAPESSKLDAMFGDLDDDDDDTFTVEPTLDTEEMKRQADARVASATSSVAQSVAPSVTSGAKDAAASRDKGKTGKTNKTTTRVLPKLDEERLLSDDGFRRLIEDSKNFKITGKGNEITDLDRLFRLYHGWTHRLFPKYQFKDTVDRVEKLCRSRRMAVNLRAWRDEVHGISPEVRHEDTEVDGENSDGDRRAASAARSLSSPSSTRPPSPVTRPNSAASMAPSVPSSATDDTTMDIDIEALIREEEEMMQEIKGGDKGRANYYKPSNHKGEDDALWTAAGGIPDTGIARTVSDFHHPSARRDEVEDDDLWDIAAEMEAQPLSAPQGGSEAAGSAVPPAEISTAPTADACVGGDWDDMYA